MGINSLPLLAFGIVSILALSAAGPSSSLPLDGRRLLEVGSHGGQFKLLHWSNREAPHFDPELSFTEKFRLAIRSSRQRVAAWSKMTSRLGSSKRTPAPAPGDFFSPLYNELFEYAMEFTIGTPPHTFTAIADTGSDLVWVQCAGCDYCVPQPDPLYDPKKSSTYINMTCRDPLCLAPQDYCSANNQSCLYDYTYGSGATVGEMAYETVTLTTPEGKKKTSKHFAFGCDYETFLYLGGVDGLVGLGQGPQSFTTQLGSLFGNKFSYCLTSIYDSNTTASALLFGDAAVPRVPTMYTPIVTNPISSYYGAATFYYIGLKGIKVNEETLAIPPSVFDFQPDGTGGVISDSGTTITYLTPTAYYPLLDYMMTHINLPISNYTSYVGLDLCYDLGDVFPIFPVVKMVFEGFDLELPFGNVFVGGPTVFPGLNSTYCMAFANSEDVMSIFGNIQQQNFQILHDREKKQFGYAKVTCDTLTT